jgi:hypothetical protein
VTDSPSYPNDKGIGGRNPPDPQRALDRELAAELHAYATRINDALVRNGGDYPELVALQRRARRLADDVYRLAGQ